MACIYLSNCSTSDLVKCTINWLRRTTLQYVFRKYSHLNGNFSEQLLTTRYSLFLCYFISIFAAPFIVHSKFLKTASKYFGIPCWPLISRVTTDNILSSQRISKTGYLHCNTVSHGWHFFAIRNTTTIWTHYRYACSINKPSGPDEKLS